MMSEYNRNVANDSMLEINGAVDGLRRIKEVASDAQARAADSLVKPAKTLVKIVHDQRMAVSRKVDALKKQLIAKENEICAELNAEIERVSGLCGAYMNAKLAEQARAAAEADARRAEAEAAAAAESALTGRNVAPVVVDEAKAGKPVDGISSRTVWTFDVVDPALVPRAYCVPDQALIRSYMNDAKKNGAKIEDLCVPGVRFRVDVRI